MRQRAQMAVGQAWRTPGLGPNSSQEVRWATSTASQWYFDASEFRVYSMRRCCLQGFRMRQRGSASKTATSTSALMRKSCSYFVNNLSTSAECPLLLLLYYFVYHLLEVICQSEGTLPVCLQHKKTNQKKFSFNEAEIRRFYSDSMLPRWTDRWTDGDELIADRFLQSARTQGSCRDLQAPAVCLLHILNPLWEKRFQTCAAGSASGCAVYSWRALAANPNRETLLLCHFLPGVG